MPGKISEYSNNGNINNWDLLDYSHENEQGSGNWETRSITLAQLQTALGGGGSGNNLAVQDQTLNAPRTISGNTANKLVVEQVPSFEVKPNINGSDFSDFAIEQTFAQTSVNSSTAAGKFKVEDDNTLTQASDGLQTIKETVDLNDGHVIEFINDEPNSEIDRIVESTNKTYGIFVNKTLQKYVGNSGTTFNVDVVEAWEDDDRVLLLPRIPKTEVTGLINQAGKFFYEIDTGELSYFDGAYQCRVQHYGQKDNTILTDTAGTYVWNVKTSFSATILNPTTAACTLEITQASDGDYGNLIFDDSSGATFSTLALPTNAGNTSIVANAGAGTIAFPPGKISTASWTFRNQKFYWVFALDYT
jgi:hypothetical protein